MLMKEFGKHGNKSKAAMKADMDRKTAAKYIAAGKLPSQMKEPRDWRTRKDPFAEDWSDIADRLEDAPELEAKALFEHLCRQQPGKYREGQLRTFQRRVKQWRAEYGPAREVFFAQEHRPGEATQTDFTHADELGVTIQGEPFEHMFCNVVLPYSDWNWPTICYSESMAALKHGVQEAIFRLGKTTVWHQTDHSTAATHRLPSGEEKFHDGYKALMRHLGMKPRTIGVGKSNQNGDVEASNGALKRRLEQHLLLRGSRDFDSVAEYEKWVHDVVRRANALRQERLDEELACMKAVTVERLPVFTEQKLKVAKGSTIRVKRNTYSVPSRLIDERVKVRIFDGHIEVRYGQSKQLEMPRLRGEGGHRIDYRHMIWSMVKKPGAFERYRYRDELFPTLVFRRAYDVFCEQQNTKRKADIEYLRVLHLAASTMECEVESALELLLDTDALRNAEDVRALVRPARPEVPDLKAPDVDLGEYDGLLGQEVGQ
jgi:hypothetical protein